MSAVRPRSRYSGDASRRSGTGDDVVYAQKVFPFLDKYGVGTWGAGQINGKTTYFAMRELQTQIESFVVDEPTDLAEASELIGNHMLGLLQEQAAAEQFDLDQWTDDYVHVGLQVVGYENDAPVTYALSIGKKVDVDVRPGLDVTVTGILDVFNALNGLYQANPQSLPLIEHFSLQDAIAYGRFLIRTTALHQQFSRAIPSVGGDIDLAVITPFDGFTWIKQKPLYKTLATEES